MNKNPKYVTQGAEIWKLPINGEPKKIVNLDPDSKKYILDLVRRGVYTSIFNEEVDRCLNRMEEKSIDKDEIDKDEIDKDEIDKDRFDKMHILLVIRDYHLSKYGGLEDIYSERLVYDFGPLKETDPLDIKERLFDHFRIVIEVDKLGFPDWFQWLATEDEITYYIQYLDKEVNNPLIDLNSIILAGVTQDQVEGYTYRTCRRMVREKLNRFKIVNVRGEDRQDLITYS